MGTEKMRDEFLAWWWHDDQLELRQSCAEGWARHIWQASRAAIEVELPDSKDALHVLGSQFDDAQCQGHNGCLGECRAALESLGLKVKP